MERKVLDFDTFCFQTNPNQFLCETSSEMNYFYNVLFKNNEKNMDCDNGLKFFIEHEENL